MSSQQGMWGSLGKEQSKNTSTCWTQSIPGNPNPENRGKDTKLSGAKGTGDTNGISGSFKKGVFGNHQSGQPEFYTGV